VRKPAGPKPNLKQTLEIIDRELKAGNLKRAETIAAHLRASYPRRAEVNDILGTILAMQGEFLVAHHYHQLAVDGDRNNIRYLENAGADLLKMGRIVEADAIYRRILEIDPRAYNAALALARFYNEIGLGERALAYFETALKLAPEPRLALINLERLNCLVALGRTAEVEKVFEEGLESGGYRPQFVNLYATLDRWNVTSDAHALVVEELQREDIAPELRAGLLTRRARIEENSGFYDAAYGTLQKAKRLYVAAADVPDFKHRCELRMATLTADFLRSCRERVGHVSEAHVFVVGMPRSGTTLTEQIIASHSMAGGVGELETMAYLTAKLCNEKPMTEIARAVDELGAKGVHQLAQEYEQVTDFLAPGKRRIVDKMPQNFVRLGEISVLFPKARFVHCVRNAADTFISAFQNDMNASHAYSYDRDTYGDYYEIYLKLMRHWYRAVPGRIFTLEYEKLVTSPEPVIRSLLAFLELPFEEACLNPQDRGALVKTFSRLQVRSSINPNSVGRWRKYEKQLAPLAKRFENMEPFPPAS
jgi:tetratricopeptide (TPR) repeat protein